MLRVSRAYKKFTHQKASKPPSTRKLLSTFLLTMIIATAITFTNCLFLPAARATYVWGNITQPTIWTLVDSPFVVSQNVTVYSNATLTIEPSVEVRFGGDFSIIVEGKLIADGMPGNMITFTSNEYQPGTGNWGTIQFNNTMQPSVLAYCSIKYATTGITAEHGNVAVTNSLISNSSQYGIFAANSTALVQSDEIGNSSICGISVTGNVTSQVVIQRNTIGPNTNGILLGGIAASDVNISNNIVLSNSQSGIQLDADAYQNLVILYNNISANGIGFFINGPANYTCITNNSISYNMLGFSYAGGHGHQAHWNDIYGNTIGMDAYYPANGSLEVVNATYNFWGEPSGPYHVSLNPAGKGDPVSGDGVNLVFIFWLTAPIGYIDQRPVASLLADMTNVSPGQQVTFFATNSTADRQVDEYFFDFGDGQTSGWTTLSVFAHEYSAVGVYNATVEVMDDFGVVSDNLASTMITCQALPSLSVSLILSSLSVSSGGQVSVTVQVGNATSPVDNANVMLFSILGGSFASSTGLTGSSGSFTTTFFAPNATLVKNIRLVASASMTGFADGSDYEYLTVQPPLIVNVATNPDIVNFEATTSVTVGVTYDGAPVDAANVAVSSNSTGSFDQTVGVTDANGTCVFVFTAPKVAIITNVMIIASASKTGLVEGLGYDYLTVQPPLIVNVTATPDAIMSKAAANVSACVTYSGMPVAGAMVALSSNSTGSFNQTIGVTDANGECAFVFTAPQTSTQLQIGIAAVATKLGYLDGYGQILLTVEPKVLLVQISASSAALNSEMSSNITVKVVYDSNPISNVTVVLSSDNGGSFSPTNATTDANGECAFVFTAPKVISPTNVTITATATKASYAQGVNQTIIAVNLGTLSVQMSAYPATVYSKATAQVTVHVTYNKQPVANALVNMFPGSVNETGTTDKNGDCTFTFTAPQTTIEFQSAITATATESGYLSGRGQISLNVKPASAPLLSLPVMIAVFAVIVAMAIVLILIKLQVIVISSEGE